MGGGGIKEEEKSQIMRDPVDHGKDFHLIMNEI